MSLCGHSIVIYIDVTFQGDYVVKKLHFILMGTGQLDLKINVQGVIFSL